MKRRGKRFLCLLFFVMVLFSVKTFAWNTGDAVLSIVSNDNGLKDFGHAFLVITNMSSKKIEVGPYILKPKEQVTLGMRDGYRGELAAQGGAYYNVEGASPNVYKSFAYKTISISASDAAAIGRYFQKNSYYEKLGDLLFHNCTTAAVRAWNSVASSADQFSEDAIDEPWKLKERIQKAKGGKTGTSLVGTVLSKAMSSEQVYYLNQNSQVIPYDPVKPKVKATKALNCNQIKLTWERAYDSRIKGQDMVTGYRIFYTANPDGAAKVIDVGRDRTEYTIGKLDSNKKYYFKIVSVYKKNGYHIIGSASESKATTKKCQVHLNRTSATLNLPKNKTLRLTASSSIPHSGSLKKVTWTSSNAKVASVNARGVVTGKENGVAYIKAVIHGKSAKCKVTVNKPSIKLNASSLVIEEGKTETLKATVKGKSKKVTWSSSNKGVATVSSKGKITAKKKGKAVITAKANGVTAKCTVTVKEVDYKSLYYKFLKKAETSFSYKEGKYTITVKAKSFYLLHLNSDSIPELIVSANTVYPGGPEAFWVFTIKDNKVAYCGNLSQKGLPEIGYSKKHKALYNSWWTNGIGGAGAALWKVNGTKLTQYKYIYDYYEGSKRIYKTGTNSETAKKVSASSSEAFAKTYFQNIVYNKRLPNTEAVRIKQFK